MNGQASGWAEGGGSRVVIKEVIKVVMKAVIKDGH